ncbi:MAG: HIT family protein [Phycisphaerales bacterium JB039]
MADDAERQALGPESIRAPWRLEYLQALSEAEDAGTQHASASFLGEYWGAPEADEANHVIVRTAAGMILLNAFPYASGHLLVALGDARARLLDYQPAQRAQLWKLVELATDLMERTLSPQGINLGINQGRAAGAGVPGHLHVHLVPRWGGDTNFVTTVGQIRVLPAALEAMAQRYRAVWGRMVAGAGWQEGR